MPQMDPRETSRAKTPKGENWDRNLSKMPKDRAASRPKPRNTRFKRRPNRR